MFRIVFGMLVSKVKFGFSFTGFVIRGIDG